MKNVHVDPAYVMQLELDLFNTHLQQPKSVAVLIQVLGKDFSLVTKFPWFTIIIISVPILSLFNAFLSICKAILYVTYVNIK